MSPLVFCQTTYPKKIVLEGDTVVLLQPIQIKKINGIIVDRDFLKSELDITQQILSYKDSLCIVRDLQIEKYGSVIKDYEESLNNMQSIVTEQEKILKEQNKKILKKSLLYGGGGIVVGVIVGLIVK